MPRGELSWDEKAAGRAVAHYLGGTCRPRDLPGAPDATHDIDVDLPNGRTIALEVTSAGDTARESMRNAAFGRRWPAPALAFSWWLKLPDDAGLKVKPLVAQVLALLAALERTEVEQIADGRNRPASIPDEAADAARHLYALGVDRATRLAAVGKGETAEVLFSIGGGVGSSFYRVNELIAERAAAKAEKIAATDADERHVWVWIRGSESGAELTMATLPPPEATPELPSCVDVVWVATTEVLWRLRPPGAWEVIPPMAQATGHSRFGPPADSTSA